MCISSTNKVPGALQTKSTSTPDICYLNTPSGDYLMSDKMNIVELEKQATITLMESTCKFMSSRAQNTKVRCAYMKAMRTCYSICTTDNTWDPHKIKSALIRHRKLAKDLFHFRFNPFIDERGSYLLAVDQCIDIINSSIIRLDGRQILEDDYVANYLRNKD